MFPCNIQHIPYMSITMKLAIIYFIFQQKIPYSPGVFQVVAPFLTVVSAILAILNCQGTQEEKSSSHIMSKKQGGVGVSN